MYMWWAFLSPLDIFDGTGAEVSSIEQLEWIFHECVLDKFVLLGIFAVTGAEVSSIHVEQLEWIFQEHMMDIFCFFWKFLLEQQSKSLRGAARTDFSVYVYVVGVFVSFRYL